MSEPTKTPVLQDENDYHEAFEKFKESPDCRECQSSMDLDGGMGWPEDPRLWVCSGCAYIVAEKGFQKIETLEAESRRLREALRGIEHLPNYLEDRIGINTGTQEGHDITGFRMGYRACLSEIERAISKSLQSKHPS